jgi:hypothetical protein
MKYSKVFKRDAKFHVMNGTKKYFLTGFDTEAEAKAYGAALSAEYYIRLAGEAVKKAMPELKKGEDSYYRVQGGIRSMMNDIELAQESHADYDPMDACTWM